VKRSPLFRIVVSLLIASAVTLGSWAGLSLNIFGGSQLRFADALLPATDMDPRVAVVGVDDVSVAHLGQWPFPRNVHAVIIDKLAQAGAKVIVYDVIFNPGTEQDAKLAESIGNAGNVILAGFGVFPKGRPTGRVIEADEFIPPVEPIAGVAAAIGHANVTPDADQVNRSLPLVIGQGADLIGSLSLDAFMATEGLSGVPTFRPDGLQVGDRLLKTEDLSVMDVNFTDTLMDPTTAGTPFLSAADVYEGNFDAADVEGKTIFVGTVDPTLGDAQSTPVGRIPGVFIHANALNTMLTRGFLAPASDAQNLAAVFALVFVIALAVQFLPMTVSWIAALGLGAAYVWFVFNRVDSSGTVMNFVYPNAGIGFGFLGSLTVKYLTEVRERLRVTRTFGRYVAKDIVAEVLAAPEDAVATLKGAMRPLSVLFADLRGFTAASENATPGDVVSALNVYLDAMTRAVTEEKGTIDKFMGDCVMAFWGAPKPDPDYADRAVRAGIKMLDYIDEAVATRPETKLLKVKGCGVGVSAGMAVVGNIGSQERLDYTAIGDTVNTASRLCGVAGAGEVVITEDCAAFLKERHELSALPPLLVKGKVEPLAVFQVLRAGQTAKVFGEGETLDATEDKGHFEPALQPVPEPPKAAGYAPVEPASTKPDGAVIGPSELTDD
jgi:adenylate cyclase